MQFAHAAKTHVFSLSLPRENHLSGYIRDKSNFQTHRSLQNLKRSVSGVLGTFGNKRDLLHIQSLQDQCENWFLSKSVPNSLNNGFNSLEFKNSRVSSDEDNSGMLVPMNMGQNTGRVMYLPATKSSNKSPNNQRRFSRSDSRNPAKFRSKSTNNMIQNTNLGIMSKSYENISSDLKSSSEPEDLQDPPKSTYKSEKIRKPKRFTFQSTVRQIERRRLAEKLSAEAERKERQRLMELEAMQKVEAEFQKKRAKEKANIRHQLRLFSMKDNTCSVNRFENNQENSVSVSNNLFIKIYLFRSWLIFFSKKYIVYNIIYKQIQNIIMIGISN